MRGVVWITGLSGAGKTTLAARLVRALREDGVWTVHVDGDRMREVFGNDLGHSPSDRRANAWRIARTCAFLAEEGALVVCSTVSMFGEIWTWNRKNIAPYLEVVLDVPFEVLRARDQRGLYSGGEVNVAGVDLEVAWPRDAHLVLKSTSEADLVSNIEVLRRRTLAMIDMRRSA